MRVTVGGGETGIRQVAACALLMALAHAGPAAARDFYLVPERSSPEPGEAVRVALHESAVFPGLPTDWRPDRTRAFFLVDAAGRFDLKDRVPVGKPLMPRVTLRSPGTTVVALVSEPAYMESPAREFQGHLEALGLDDVLEMRQKMRTTGLPGRERCRRYVKTLLNAGGVASDVALANLNLTIEIVPETQPAGVRPGGRLPVKVLFEGMAYSGGLLCSTHAGFTAKPGAYAWCGRLDEGGRAAVPIEASGWQLLRTTRMRALAGDDRADWAVYGTALTFEVPAHRSPR